MSFRRCTVPDRSFLWLQVAFAVVKDGAATEMFNVNTYPTMYLFNGLGQPVLTMTRGEPLLEWRGAALAGNDACNPRHVLISGRLLMGCWCRVADGAGGESGGGGDCCCSE